MLVIKQLETVVFHWLRVELKNDDLSTFWMNDFLKILDDFYSFDFKKLMIGNINLQILLDITGNCEIFTTRRSQGSKFDHFNYTLTTRTYIYSKYVCVVNRSFSSICVNYSCK